MLQNKVIFQAFFRLTWNKIFLEKKYNNNNNNNNNNVGKTHVESL